MREVPALDGTVTYVAADQQIDERTGQPYFVGRVKILPESLESVKDVSLYPGMPAEVLIVTGERRAIDYLRSEKHTSDIQTLMRISYTVLCLKKKKITITQLSLTNSPLKID